MSELRRLENLLIEAERIIYKLNDIEKSDKLPKLKWSKYPRAAEFYCEWQNGNIGLNIEFVEEPARELEG